MKPSHIILSLAISLLVYTSAQAGPVINFCINEKCKQPGQVQINDAQWHSIKNLFNTPFSTDKDEQDNIVNAISIITSDIYGALAKTTAEDDTAQDLFDANSDFNKMRNLKTYLGLLLDERLVTRHYVRKIILIPHSWTNIERPAILLQSLSDSTLYTLFKQDELSSPPLISNYKHEKESFSMPVLNKVETPVEDDTFE